MPHARTPPLTYPTGASIMFHSLPYMPSSSHTLMPCLILYLPTLPHHFTPMLHFTPEDAQAHMLFFFFSLNTCGPNLTVSKQQEVMNSFYGCVMVSAITYPIPSVSYHRNRVQSQLILPSCRKVVHSTFQRFFASYIIV